jgi:phosphatidylserine/phosphatidylglycerophosphate/cardiolipin synthase-like enzyme
MNLRQKFAIILLFCWELALAMVSGSTVAVNQCVDFYSKQIKQSAHFMYKEDEVGQARLEYIRNETKEIFMSYLLFDGNKGGRLILAELREAARRGVKVRILVDGWGVDWWMDAAIDLPTVAALASEGVEIRQFNPVNTKSITAWITPKLWKRSHDKLAYFGSQNAFFIGDRNMQNINFRLRKKKTPDGISYRGQSYLSVETLVSGNMAHEVKDHLEKIWEHSKPRDFSKVTFEEMTKVNHRFDRIMRVSNNIKLPFIDWNSRLVPVENIKFFSETVETKGIDHSLEEEQLRALNSAQTNIVIISPYIRFDKKYFDAIQGAINRGATVNIYVPSLATNDNIISAIAFEPQSIILRKMGVRIRQIDQGDFLHAKLIRVDDNYTNITSHNFNKRSNVTDLESAVAITDKAYARTVDESFISMLEKKSEEYETGGCGQSGRLQAACARVLMPVLLKFPLVDRQF